MTKVQNFIGGELVDSVSGAHDAAGRPDHRRGVRHRAGLQRAGHRQRVRRRVEGFRRLEAHHTVAPAEGAARFRRRCREERSGDSSRPRAATPASPTTSRWPKRSLRWSTRSGSSPVRQGFWRASRPASTWRTTPRGSAVSRSA